MFDMNKVAKNIKSARTKKNMTQMNLADEMGVSYQAVSNWERGNSMPDISKLPELCKILDISFEELVGERTAQTEVAEKMMQDENADVTLEEMAQVGQLVKPDKIENKVNETMEKGGKITFSALVGLAPFMDRETLSRMAEEIAEEDLKKLCAIAPFLERTTLDRIVERCMQNDRVSMNGVLAVAPFLSKETIQKIAKYLTEHNRSGEVVAIAPFMGKTSLSTQWGEIVINGKKSDEKQSNTLIAEVADDEEEEDEEEVAKKHAHEALEQGTDISEYLDYMWEDDVAELALKALEMGKDTGVFLDYMDEDGVAELAFKAFEIGKPVECYLDYMDEDAIKELLLKSLKR